MSDRPVEVSPSDAGSSVAAAVPIRLSPHASDDASPSSIASDVRSDPAGPSNHPAAPPPPPVLAPSPLPFAQLESLADPPLATSPVATQQPARLQSPSPPPPVAGVKRALDRFTFGKFINIKALRTEDKVCTYFVAS